MEPSRQTWSSYGRPYPLGHWCTAVAHVAGWKPFSLHESTAVAHVFLGWILCVLYRSLHQYLVTAGDDLLVDDAAAVQVVQDLFDVRKIGLCARYTKNKNKNRRPNFFFL